MELKMDDFEKELKISFLVEAFQASRDVEQCFLSLENNPEDEENLNKIFRLAHNLKGSSKAVGFDEFGAFTHEFESFILRIKKKEIPSNSKSINLLLRANDFILHMINLLTQDLTATFSPETLINEMKNYTDHQEVNCTDSWTSSAIQTHNPPASEIIVKKNPQQKNASVDDSLRVSIQKIEHLINSVGEMVILQSGLKEQATLLNSPVLKRIVQHLDKVSKDIQETSMNLRMVPIKPVFQKMQRIVRDTSIALDKDVLLNLTGEDTDIDKTVLERISDPLVHLIRNSVDHGIEHHEIRTARGKPSRGTVTLKAYHQAGKLVIEVSDDGGGLDTEKLRQKAIEKNIISVDSKLSEKECFNLIFAPGFSTKEQVTEVSGRGVGMDVVKTYIQELGGEIHIDSTLHKGSTFKILLPLTLAIVDAMVLSYAAEKFVIPLSQVFETLKPKPENVKETPIGRLLLLRNENLPLFKLGEFFNLKNSKKHSEMIAIVVRNAPTPFAFLVDDIIGQHQVVIKQLGLELQNMVAVCGSTILSDGKPSLIIEAQDLLKRARSDVDYHSQSKRSA